MKGNGRNAHYVDQYLEISVDIWGTLLEVPAQEGYQ